MSNGIEFLGRQIAIASFVSLSTLALLHPLDTIRVRMQIRTSEPSVFRVIAATYQGEGVRGFYKGMLSPLITLIPYNSVVFTAFQISRRLLD